MVCIDVGIKDCDVTENYVGRALIITNIGYDDAFSFRFLLCMMHKRNSGHTHPKKIESPLVSYKGFV